MALCAKAVGGPSIDRAEVRRALAVLADPAHGCELRGLPSGRSAVRPGGDLDALVDAADMLSTDLGVYYCLNPVPPGLDHCCRVGDVLARRWLLVDVDPAKPAEFKDDPATDREQEAARLLACCVAAHLASLGWPEPVWVDSGNGWHLLYRVDLPASDHVRVLFRALLGKLKGQFDGPQGTIDNKVHNASRIAKLPGTVARKGSPTAERPHRRCRLVKVPGPLVCVTAEQIAAAAGVAVGPVPEANGQAPTAAPRPSGLKARATNADDRRAAYLRKALEHEAGLVAMAAPGERNAQLNRAAFALGQLVGTGELGRAAVEEALREAGRRCGLLDDPGCGPAGVEATLKSGIDAGLKEPRKVPEGPDRQGRGAARPDVPTEDLPGPVTLLASSIRPRKVEWLWPWRIPLGKLTTFAGMGGIGKTFVLCDLAARVTRGDEWPDSAGECCEPGEVLFISGEDDADDTLVPRLIELKADLTRVRFLQTRFMDRFQLADVATLKRALDEARGQIRFVAIDPPTAYLGQTDDHHNAQLRTVLTPLKTFAAEYRVALVFNTHMNKGSGAKVQAMMRVMGSVAWVNAVRAAHLFTRDPEDPGRRLFLPMKSNLAKERKGLSFRIVERPDDQAAVEWVGEVEVTADEAVNREERRPRKAVAREWLVARFREKREWTSEELFGLGKAQGVSRNAIFEARNELPLPKARKVTSENGDVQWVWWVPPDWSPVVKGGGAGQSGRSAQLDEVSL